MIIGGLPEGGVRVAGLRSWAGKGGVVWKLSAGFEGIHPVHEQCVVESYHKASDHKEQLIATWLR